ncbi:MAG TPA: hypothetical protein VKF62_04360 [Planctomycetota bacterium]|nr:hypothetical protein [Planctomycetota bacterium]
MKKKLTKRDLTYAEKCARLWRAVRPYLGKHVAIDYDAYKVVAVGRTWEEASRKALAAGFPDVPILMAADYNKLWI